MKNRIFALLLTYWLPACVQPNVNSHDKTNKQTVEISVDNKKYNLSANDVLSLSYIGQAHLGFAVLSEKNDISFVFSAFMSELKPGTFEVWDCKSASSCTKEEDDLNQTSILTPYPKIPMAPVNLSRIAYKSSELGLTPLTVTISSVNDEQQPDVPFKTKRVKGEFTGTLAYVEQQQDGHWKIVGSTTKLEGKFDMLCSIR